MTKNPKSLLSAPRSATIQLPVIMNRPSPLAKLLTAS